MAEGRTVAVPPELVEVDQDIITDGDEGRSFGPFLPADGGRNFRGKAVGHPAGARYADVFLRRVQVLIFEGHKEFSGFGDPHHAGIDHIEGRIEV